MALKNLLVKVGVSTKGLNADLRRTKNNFRRNFGEIQSLVNSTGRAMTASITAPLGLMAVQSVQAFNTQAKAIAQVEAGLRSTGEQVGYTSQQLQRMASDLQTKTLFGDEEILSGATAQLLTFTNISGEQFARTQVAALDLATRLDGDLKSASIQLGKALNDPIANLSALSRSGIQFSAEQKEVIKALTETGRLAEAQTIILDELEKQYGGSAEAAAKAGTGGLKQLQNSIGDLQEQFGALIVEVMTPMVKHVQRVVAAFQTLSTDTKKNILIVAGLLGAAGPIALAVGALMPIFAALTGPIGLVAAAVGALSYLIIDNFSYIEPAIVAVVNSVITFQNKTKLIGVVFAAIKGYLVGWFNFVKLGFRSLFDVLAAFGNALTLVLEGKFGEAGDVISDTFKAIGSDFVETGQEAGSNLMQGINDALNAEDIELLEPDSISRFARKLKSDISGALSSGDTGPVDVPVQPRMQGMAARGVPAAAAATGGLLISADAAGATSSAINTMNDMVAVSVDLAGQASSAFVGLGESLAGIAMGTMNFGGLMAGVLVQLADLLGMIGQQFIAAGVAAMNFYANLIANPFAAVAAGVALVAASGIIKALGGKLSAEPPALAEGGLAFGRTLATVGDNPNAAINPEVIAPLSKLRDMMGGGNVTVTGRLDGRDILISSERAGFDRNRVRGF